VTDEQLRGLYRSPDVIEGLLYPDMPSVKPSKQSLFARLFGRERSRKVGGLPTEDQMDLDKAWHVLHFLFTGSAWEGEFPQGFLVSCGKPVGDVDVGYGPARGYTPAEVAQISAYLESLDLSALRTSLGPKRLSEEGIYPDFGSEEPISDEDWEYCSGAFNNMAAFVSETASRQMALLVYIN